MNDNHRRTDHNERMLDQALRAATDVAGDRWVLLALGALAGGPRRFGDLATELDGIAPNVLTDRLRRMERDGLVVATLYSQRPRRYVYDLTESGRELAAVLPALSAWAARRGGGEPRRHSVCGAALQTRVWCPTCAVVVDDDGEAGTGADQLTWV
ncbi:MAG TPA: helix-turn-helix domain-containing protein [Ilumatobacteraceae bacterium]|jgi:DNA-binding HxlR family transcriptional regulator